MPTRLNSKHEIRNPKQIQNSKSINQKHFEHLNISNQTKTKRSPITWIVMILAVIFAAMQAFEVFEGDTYKIMGWVVFGLLILSLILQLVDYIRSKTK